MVASLQNVFIGLMSIAILASADMSVAAGPKFKIRSYSEQVCLDASSPPYDFGAWATETWHHFEITNIGDGIAYNFDVRPAGSEVPGVFDDQDGANTYTGSGYQLRPGRSFFCALRFRPSASDPSGTLYGGDASRAVMIVSGTSVQKPNKKSPPPVVLQWVLKGQKE
jgi:hypothetical protein